ncbi:MAG: DUF1294 domain-containing protein [Lachnospiraceae bacterium]
MNTVVKIIVIYLILMTLAGFFSMGIDKRRAIRHAYRIPEATLFLIAALGGSLGSILGMRHFRHKTRHRKFVWGMPGILILQIILGTALGIALRKYFF